MQRVFRPDNNNFMNQNNNEPNQFNNGCGCKEMNNNCGCPNPRPCPPTCTVCPPIVTCSKKVIEQYHITKQPYIHNYHTEVVHHHITQNEFIPQYTCSEVHVQEPAVGATNNFNPNI